MSPFGSLEILTIHSTDPWQRGLEHGERLKKGVQRMAQLRLSMMLDDTDFDSESEVLNLAEKHLPLLKSFDNDLYEELLGIAHGASISPELVVIINHYTDMRDIRKNPSTEDLGGCSVIFSPSRTGPLLGQTWDVHGSAMEHVFILKLEDQLLFSVAGCLGMTGMNRAGVGVTINNLCSYDAKVGIIWPALVRKILKASCAADGLEIVMNAELGSGHHYVIADRNDLYAIETSGTQKKITQSNASVPHIHTNHCLDPKMRETHGIRNKSTTFERFRGLEEILTDTQLESTSAMFEAFGRVSLPFDSNDIHKTTTCGSLVMDLRHGAALASKGPPSETFFNNSPLSLQLEGIQ